MDGYNQKSCNALEKPYYRPIEAALRWCNLIDHELDVLRNLGTNAVPPIGAFPLWPCLRINTEKIFDAIQNGDLPHGRDGKTVQDGDHVAPARVTVRHTDLRAWMAKHFPDQRPPFLFDETERNTHSAINVETLHVLQAKLITSEASLEKAKEEYLKLKSERDNYAKEVQQLRGAVEQEKPLNTRERNTLLTIIAALCKEATIDYNTASKAANLIQGAAAELGVNIGETTIEGHLKKIPDALENRMK